MISGHSIVFTSLLPAWVTVGLCGSILLLCALSWLKSPAKALVRTLFGLLLVLFILQPQLVSEQRKSLKDVLLVVSDKSQSQNFGDRLSVLQSAQAHLVSQLDKDLDIRHIDVASGANDETKIFEQIEAALADVPPSQRAGTILLSDGEVTDAPSKEFLSSSPFSVLLTGSHNDRDREIKILTAPGYGLLNETVLLKFRIEDHNMNSGGSVAITLNRPDGTSETHNVMPNTDVEWPITVTSAGPNIFELSTDVETDEISPLNNRAIISVQGVRNRLHVLLVSGEPYPGARMWRDILKADPGIDLVHFTILRSPEKIDMTPQNQLSLIAFPFQELFQNKLKSFDLVIMDGFSLNTVLPDYYFQNIRDYVLNGGALLEIDGPAYAGDKSMFHTSLGDILPGAPNGPMIQQNFKAKITEFGKTHPVTMPLASLPAWGSWLQQMPVTAVKGDVLMTGVNDNPLLILARTGEGRVAQLTSNQIWLWARGFDGGGPVNEFLRRVVHWLMKEPELDENALDIKDNADALQIRTRESTNNQIDIVKPDGKTEKVTLQKASDGWLTGSFPKTMKGIYKFSDGARIKVISSGDTTTPEYTNIITTDKNLAPFVQQSGGKLIWAEDHENFDVSSIPIKRNHSSTLVSSKLTPLARPELLLLLALVAGLLMWWYEGRKPKRLS